jgi:hypothetical protein
METDESDTSMAFWLIMIIFVVLVYMQIYALYKYHLSTRECKYFNSYYKNMNGKISSQTKEKDYTLCNYNILTAYNCCSSGAYKNDYVNTCILTDILKQGARCLDFAIYSIDNEPVVASSTSTNYFVKETYNFVNFSSAMGVVKNNAFSSAVAPNPQDPIIIHLRLYSTNKTMMNKIAEIFKAIGSRQFMDNDENYGSNRDGNFGDTVKLSKMAGKIVVVVNGQKAVYEDTDLYEWVNMESGTANMQLFRFRDIKNTPDIKETIILNKHAMTMVLPDMFANPENPSGIVCRELGCQMVALRFQQIDNAFSEHLSYFNNSGKAFVLKDKALRDTTTK